MLTGDPGLVMSTDTTRLEINDGNSEKQTESNETIWASKDTAIMSKLIMSRIERYRLPHTVAGCKPLGTSSALLGKIERFVARGESVCMVLPAFPFKSANKAYKVPGKLPDKGEETALLHLEGLCKAVEEVYENGARLTIVSDGLVYNDILRVNDEEVWKYGQALRQMAKDCSCDHLQFARLCDLLDQGSFVEPQSEEAYTDCASQIRSEIVRRYLPCGFDVSEAITGDPDIKYTYCGYARFLNLELETQIKTRKMTTEHTRRFCKDIAKCMIVRGKAFAEAIASAFPEHLRLSIHPSTDIKKLSIALIPQKGRLQMTPWHSAFVRASDGSITMSHAGAVCKTTHELVMKDDQPWFFEARFNLPD